MDLRRALQKETRSEVLKSHYKFISLEALDRLVTLPNVRSHLAACRVPIRTEELQKIVSRSRKLFAILVLIGQETAIKECLLKGFCDRNFPIGHIAEIPEIGSDHTKRALHSRQWRIPIVLQRSQHLVLPSGFIPPFLDRDYRANGAFGVVYKVYVAKGHLTHHHDSSVPLALKVVRKEEKHKWKILMREVETLQARVHEHIVPLLSSWSHPSLESERLVEKLYLLFPYSSTNLEDWLNLNEPPKDWCEVGLKELKEYIYTVMESLCDAVAYLHKAVEGLISSHHDLKPSNILLFGKDWKIADFGRTHLIRLSQGSDTEGISGLGTYDFHPPEYWDSLGNKADLRHGRAFDVWGLGCIILELATIAVYGWSSGKLQVFSEARKINEISKNPSLRQKRPEDASYHNNINVVRDWMQQLQSYDGSSNMTSVLQIADTMLNTDPNDRPPSWESYLDLHELFVPNDTYAEKEDETRDKTQEPNPRHPKTEQNPLQRAVAKENKLRVKWLLRKGWDGYPVKTASLNGKDIEIIRMVRIARVIKGIRWRRACRKIVKNSRTSEQGSDTGALPVTHVTQDYRTALIRYDKLSENSTPLQSMHPKKPTRDDVDLNKDERGMTVLHRLCEQSHYWQVQSFLDKKSQEFIREVATRTDLRGRLPIHYAASNGSDRLVQLLLESVRFNPTALVAWPDSDGRTPLHKAAEAGNAGTILPLFKAHLDRSGYLAMVDNKSFTAYDLATQRDNREAAEQLAKLRLPWP
ncbi:MAG: hypothetical protein Q9167_004425 [Letrouitia subvulpina]